MLESLPPELLLCILKCLPLQSLSVLRQTSKQWNQRFVEHGPYIYRNAASHHGFISSPEMTLDQAIQQAKTAVKDVSTWVGFCRQRYQTEKNWLGRGAAWCRGLAEAHDDLHRIKIDEERGFLITTHQDGGLNVRDLETDTNLWSFPPAYVRRYAHCEYGNGFLIFDRFGHGKEVWRIASEPEESPASRDESQYRVYQCIAPLFPESKAAFKPWAVLTTPEHTRAYRFVYPMLLVAGPEKAYLWDVPRCDIARVIPDIQTPMAGEILGDINYVELSPLHVIICGSRQLRLFDRTSGACVWYMRTSPAGQHYKSIVFTPASVPPPDVNDFAVFPRSPEPGLLDPHHYSQYVAVHASNDGRTIAALTKDCSLLLIKDIIPIIMNRVKLEDASLTLTFNQSRLGRGPGSAIYLAFEFGRVGVITSSGVFVITLDATQHGILVADRAQERREADLSCNIPARVAIAQSPFPFLQCCQILPFNQARALRNVTCLQMSQGRMFFIWDPRAMPDELDGDSDAVDSSDSDEIELLQPHMPGTFQAEDEDADGEPDPELWQAAHHNPDHGTYLPVWDAEEDEGEIIQVDEDDEDDEENDDEDDGGGLVIPHFLPAHLLLQDDKL
ncbi:uncharacterized protein PHACADRAFT_197864 [Phanerochaete carnosa HHB-10118-sp]|uniref:F-box domain-containing protein n=1 Tax=Phanerochaete carnosa (strain HHB-10118-sp) TaxID=650164 RepID=K5VPQ7_PHACS|nr:uncharacterized protein PHACADRAFT_197864 [Phanerochaete carnosa HHB-10118-sp]EKM53433.1 hypothetical protein PHACADRAFT_197864 [Phanerochaete carnosa HHB-10118-sp]